MDAKPQVRGVKPLSLRAGTFTRWNRAPLALVLLGMVAAVSMFVNLGQRSLVDWDEAIYAQIAREMVQSGDWLTPHFNDQLWFEKPPLLFWITATFFSLFGVNEFWARAASALAGTLVVLVAYAVGRQIYNRWVGLLATIPLLTNLDFLEQSRHGMTDMLLTLCIWVSVYGYLRVRAGNPRWWYGVWIAFGLGFMVKGWAALAAPAVIGLTLAADRSWTLVRSKHFRNGLVMALGIIAPWHLFMLASYGRPFLDRYVMYDLVARANTNLDVSISEPQYYFYFVKLQQLLAPWWLLIPVAVALAIKELQVDRTKSRIVLCLLLLIFGVFSLVIKTKIEWYVTPLYPALAILIGVMLFQALQSSRSVAFGGLLFAALAASLFESTHFIQAVLGLYVGAAICLLIIWAVLQRRPIRSGLTGLPEHRVTAEPEALPLGRSWPSRFREQMAPLLVAASLCLLLALISARKASFAYQGGKEAIATIAKIAGSGPYQSRGPLLALTLLSDLGNSVQGPTALFYSNRPLTVAWSLEELAALTNEREAQDILISQTFMETLAADYEFHVWAQAEQYVYATIQRRAKP